jgi:DNA-binding transcriptional LysR family regulator
LQLKKILQKQQNYYIFPNLHLSKQIKILEKNLDILLINRENNKISLTENGKVFLQYSERILALCEESCRALIDLKNGERGNLTVGASQTIGTYLLPRVLSFICSKLPTNRFKSSSEFNTNYCKKYN